MHFSSNPSKNWKKLEGPIKELFMKINKQGFQGGVGYKTGHFKLAIQWWFPWRIETDAATLKLKLSMDQWAVGTKFSKLDLSQPYLYFYFFPLPTSYPALPAFPPLPNLALSWDGENITRLFRIEWSCYSNADSTRSLQTSLLVPSPSSFILLKDLRKFLEFPSLMHSKMKAKQYLMEQITI